MKTSRLQEKLKNLDLEEIRRSAAAGEVPSEFREIAELVFNGHFLVSSATECVKVYPTCIEMYWHEEQGEIQDNIVYHRNGCSSINPKPAIFTLGVLHNHVSGIDLTFEQGDDPESAIRASMLIREYKVVKNGKIICEKRPTYLYTALYGQFSVFDGGFSVKWEEDENVGRTIACTPRHNVTLKNEQGAPVPDERPWRFTLDEHDTRR